MPFCILNSSCSYSIGISVTTEFCFKQIAKPKFLMATNEAEVLREVFPKCLELLHVKDVTPYLFAKRVINSSEYEELCGGSHLPSQRSLAERLLVMMMRKGRRCATHLLLALQDSVRSRYPQPSHRELIDELSKALRLDCDQSESDSPDMPHANGNSNGEYCVLDRPSFHGFDSHNNGEHIWFHMGQH